MNIAFIGLGNMGSAMATNLIKAGHTLSVFNRTRARRRTQVSVWALRLWLRASLGRKEGSLFASSHSFASLTPD